VSRLPRSNHSFSGNNLHGFRVISFICRAIQIRRRLYDDSDNAHDDNGGTVSCSHEMNIIRHIACITWMRPLPTDSVTWSVCWSVTTVRPAQWMIQSRCCWGCRIGWALRTTDLNARCRFPRPAARAARSTFEGACL